jgi:hypothetical protein
MSSRKHPQTVAWNSLAQMYEALGAGMRLSSLLWARRQIRALLPLYDATPGVRECLGTGSTSPVVVSALDTAAMALCVFVS